MPSVTAKYVNHLGQTFILQGDGRTFINEDELHTYEWSYSLANRVSGMGGVASGFARWPRTFDMEIRTRGYSHAEFLELCNKLHAITDVDAMDESPGRLYVGDQYMVCFLAVASDEPSHPRNSNFLTRQVTVLAVEPYWCTEVSNMIYPSTGQSAQDTTGKKYNYNYPYRYGTGISGNRIINNHYAAAPAVITFFGPVINPSVEVSGNVYAVNVTLTATDRLVIDQIKRQIYIVSERGTRTNVFNARDKQHNIFQPFPAGVNPIIYSGDFAFDITLVYQRSELKWTV